MQQKAPWPRTLGTENGERLLAVRRYLKPEACCKSTTLQMIQIQILAESSDKPSISSEGFSPSIFTAFVCSYLLKSVPKPLKDTSLGPWIGGGGGVCTQWRTWMFILVSAPVGLMPLHLSYPGLPGESWDWTVFGTRKMGHGVFWTCAYLSSGRATPPETWHIQFQPSPLLPICSYIPMCAAQARKSDAHFAFSPTFSSCVY